MNRIAVAVTSFAVVALALAGAYFGAPYAGYRMELPVLVALAAILAAGCSASLLMLSIFNRPTGGRSYGSTRLNDDPVWRFIAPFRQQGAIQILARPMIPVEIMLMRHQSVFDNPAEHADRKIVLTLKKAKRGGEDFNPVVLKKLFEKLKPFTKSEHVLLVNEHDEFMGYIPWENAVKEFTSANAETNLGKYVVAVLADPSKSAALRTINGMGVDDIISDTATIHDAAKMTWFDDPLHGLVVYSGKRNRKPMGVINKNGLLQLISTGA